MSPIFAGFICAIILAIFVVVWITYCMFFKEKHKSEVYQYNIYDLQHEQVVEEIQENAEKKEKRGLAAGVILLPSRHKQKEDEYRKRPDYPESPVHNVQAGNEDFMKMLNDTIKPELDTVDAIEIGSNSQYHSEV